MDPRRGQEPARGHGSLQIGAGTCYWASCCTKGRGCDGHRCSSAAGGTDEQDTMSASGPTGAWLTPPSATLSQFAVREDVRWDDQCDPRRITPPWRDHE
jgi:hypothetical protein